LNPLWNELAQRAGIALDAQQDAALSRYLDLLLEANQKMNLTRITDRTQAELHHVGDALTLLPFLPSGPFTLADVGSGGGVPGIPIAIARPDARVVLIESTRKKAAFLTHAISELKIPATATSARAEEIARTAQRESFDIVTARAVGALAWLAEWCLPLVKPGGKVLAMKGEKVHEELPIAPKIIDRLGGADPIVHPVHLSGTEHHVIVEIKKVHPTDPKYPRDPTTTRGNPLS
jgi:16S rRNA (guanine527-N7)-methyltransferase